MEAFREERSPGTSPAGKEVSWVGYNVYCSPDSRPRRLSTNRVCVGADGWRASWRQEPREEGQAAGSGSRLAGQLNGALAVNWSGKAPPFLGDGKRERVLYATLVPSFPTHMYPLSPGPVYHISDEEKPDLLPALVVPTSCRLTT